MNKRIEHPKYSVDDSRRMALANARDWVAVCQANVDGELVRRGVVSARTADALKEALAILAKVVRS